MRINFVILLVILSIIELLSIEVGGHITEDTTWSPDNNPYLVTSGVYVDYGVSLTIQPGTIIKLNAALHDQHSDEDFYFQNGEEPEAKFIRCDGKIIAEGTEQDSIIFTRLQDEQYFHWGTVYLTETADFCSFKHCKLEFSAFTGFSLFEQPKGAISIYNGIANISECSLYNNDRAISTEGDVIDISITDNYFNNFESYHPNIAHVHGTKFIQVSSITGYDIETPLIAGNTFMNSRALLSGKNIHFIFNHISYTSSVSVHNYTYGNKSYFYSNEFVDCFDGIDLGIQDNDKFYVKNNSFTDCREGVHISYGYVELVDNFFNNSEADMYGCVDSSSAIRNVFYNNEPNTSFSGSINNISNNIFFNCETGFGGIGYEYCINHLFLNNQYAISSVGSIQLFQNSIFINNSNLYENFSGSPTFRNCIIDMELPPEIIDGGGNIIVDSLQAQSVFEDILNGDFHLAPGSIAIDAGFDTLGYYYPFDLDYNHRVWDGDNNGSAIIDIGPYEYGAPAFGGIQGNTYNPITGLPVDYVLIKINNEPGEFTFSDNIGSYQYKLPAGIYDVYVERVFYDDAVEYQIEVIDGQFTQLDIPMIETVNVQNYEIIPIKNDFNLSNFPNPFNPSTTISFSLPIESRVDLIIYNIKGQQVKAIVNDIFEKGSHSVTWNGFDDSGNLVSSGVYFYKLYVNNKEELVRKCLLLK